MYKRQVLITVFTGVLVAPGRVYFLDVLFFLLMMAFLVFGAATLNCFIERDVDGKMDRTKDRPLPSKRLSPGFVLFFGTTLCTVSLGALFVYSNLATFTMAVIATVSYLFIYTPLKQKTEIALYVGAIPGALPPLMGWTYVTGSFSGVGIFLFAILFVWQLPHFLAIAIYHGKDYDAAKIQVLPNLRGHKLAVWLIIGLSFLMIIISGAPAYLGQAPKSYGFTALTLSLVLFLYSVKGAFLLNKGSESETIVWARNYFWGTIIYLPLLLGSMLILIQ